MSHRVRTPPGRMGRLFLERRLGSARRSAELLDRKQRVLRSEMDRLQELAHHTAQDWQTAAAEAALWLRRAGALAGQRGLEQGASPPAEVDVVWEVTVGVRRPVRAECSFLHGAEPPVGGPALIFAAAAHRRALMTAVAHAAAERAVVLLSAELAVTRARLRAVENRWIPALEGTLRAVTTQLDELDREEGLRLRWATEGDRPPTRCE